MGFFNPLDVITGGASALPGTGMGQKAAAIGQGSLGALGSGVGRNAPIYNPVQPPQNGPQPVPGMPPRSFDGPVIGTGFPGPGQPPFDPNVVINGGYGSEGPGGFTGHAQDPNFRPMPIPGGPYGNRGSGQPINQPMNPNQGHVTPIAGPGFDYNYDPTTGRGTQTNSRGQTTDYNYPASQLPNQGSLQSLGGGQLNQSGMVTLRGTDGTTKAVPQQDLAHWLSKGAVRV